MILVDGFNSYTNGPIIGNLGGTLWSAHSGASGLPVVVTNGQIKIDGSHQEDISATLVGQPYTTNSGSVLYARFTFRVVERPTQPTYVAHFKDNTSSGYRCRVFLSTNNAPAEYVRVAIGSGADSTLNGGVQLQINLGKR